MQQTSRQFAYVSEIYSSIQGEGPYTGQPQIFLRLAGCPLRCSYCDTPESLTTEGHPRMAVDDVARAIEKLAKRQSGEMVSITGGEPLVQWRFLSELLPILKSRGFKIYLETAGVHPDSLVNIVDLCDVISMDVKLPSAIDHERWDEHERFLKIGAGRLFVKVVIERSSTADELQRVIGLLQRLSTIPLLVLQPATPVPEAPVAPSAEQMIELYALAARQLSRVMVMTQQHKAWGLR